MDAEEPGIVNISIEEGGEQVGSDDEADDEVANTTAAGVDDR
jgi:hypothetical protein